MSDSINHRCPVLAVVSPVIAATFAYDYIKLLTCSPLLRKSSQTADHSPQAMKHRTQSQAIRLPEWLGLCWWRQLLVDIFRPWLRPLSRALIVAAANGIARI